MLISRWSYICTCADRTHMVQSSLLIDALLCSSFCVHAETQDVPIKKRRECILKALVVYVNEDLSNLVKEYMDVEHEAQTSMRNTTLGIYVIKPEGAHATDPYQDVGIIVEGIKILENLNNVANACSMMLGLIYALNLAYPQDLRYTFETF